MSITNPENNTTNTSYNNYENSSEFIVVVPTITSLISSPQPPQLAHDTTTPRNYENLVDLQHQQRQQHFQNQLQQQQQNNLQSPSPSNSNSNSSSSSSSSPNSSNSSTDTVVTESTTNNNNNNTTGSSGIGGQQPMKIVQNIGNSPPKLILTQIQPTKPRTIITLPHLNLNNQLQLNNQNQPQQQQQTTQTPLTNTSTNTNPGIKTPIIIRERIESSAYSNNRSPISTSENHQGVTLNRLTSKQPQQTQQENSPSQISILIENAAMSPLQQKPQHQQIKRGSNGVVNGGNSNATSTTTVTTDTSPLKNLIHNKITINAATFLPHPQTTQIEIGKPQVTFMFSVCNGFIYLSIEYILDSELLKRTDEKKNKRVIKNSNRI